MLPDIRNILYSTDLSKNAVFAFRYAVDLAQKTGANVHVLHVVEALSNDAKITLQAYVQDKDARKKALYERVDRAKNNLDERLENFWAACTEEERKVSSQIATVNVCESYPPEEILKKADELNCDLIIMGTHEKGIMHTFLGSVTKSVLHRSRIPTLVVPLPEK